MFAALLSTLGSTLVGAMTNAGAFVGISAGARALSHEDEERKRHNMKMEKFQKDHNSWIEKRQNNLDAERKRRQLAQSSEGHLQELDASMREYAAANPEPQFHQYYHPSQQQKYKDYLGAIVVVAAVGGIAYYVL